MSLNLAPIQRMVEEQFLDDTIALYPAAERSTLAKMLDPVTLRLVDGPRPDRLWTGQASVMPASLAIGLKIPDIADQAVPTDTTYDYRSLLPLALTIAEAGHIIEITESLRDPLLVGTAFRIGELPTVSTFAVCRIALLTRLSSKG